MTLKFELYSIQSLVNFVKYPIQEDEIDRSTKTLVVLKNGLKFRKKDGWLLKSKANYDILWQYNQKLYVGNKFEACLTDESKELAQNLK